MCVFVHRSFWHWGLMNVLNDISNNKTRKRSTHKTDDWVTTRQKRGMRKGRWSIDFIP